MEVFQCSGFLPGYKKNITVSKTPCRDAKEAIVGCVQLLFSEYSLTNMTSFSPSKISNGLYGGCFEPFNIS
jgi:hypothetical protein